MDLTEALSTRLTNDRPRVDQAAGHLVGTRCRSCGAASWPGRAICHRCGSAAVDEADFATSGHLLTYTTVHVARPGLPVPYLLGQIRLDDDGPVVFGHVRRAAADARVPYPVRLMVSESLAATPWYWFEPDSTTGEGDH